ncbi:stage V sporulation protein AD [Caldicoprobacter guelmensis]|uniref:stage V sporulation protein AD n=1 Tax=Caldicoprobacter guelmensis TaxID=1170224 RepID=UPI00195B88C5|nr:stage V sporulation protein AD [Caldicoprobacter guelmensis]MBM7581359.1 stage V sporulation protein AD [Caldicoprobacter guelmensis]
MAKHRLGGQTIELENPPCILSRATIVGKKEGEGPLGEYFDVVLEDNMWGEKTWEKAERRMYLEAAQMAISRAGKQPQDINYLFGGDLLNQIITANFAARTLGIPFFGLYGACSTLTESLSLGAMLVSAGYADLVLCVTSSHFCTAERQYRFPLEMGTQRPPTAQWTVTGAGAFLLSNDTKPPYITHVTTGKVIDYGITDANNMGAAMAPAAAATIKAHFEDTGQGPEAYDLIVTGDLGWFGRELTIDLLKKEGYDISDRFIDCGCEIYSKEQDVHAGGSGCGCSAVVFGAYILRKMEEGVYRRILLLSTGALLSTTSSQQGESIPGIAHAVTIDMNRG